MKRIASFLLALLVSSAFGQQQRPIGINIATVTDYSTELVFTNAFLQTRPWISCNADGSGPWDTEINVPLGAKGFPLQIPYDNGTDVLQGVRTLLISSGAARPQGMYRLIISGTGKVRLNGAVTGTQTIIAPCNVLINVVNDNALIMRVSESAVGDPINDIKVIYPDYVDSYQTKVFTDEFLDFLTDFSVLRFMDWSHTNASQVVNWDDRGKFDYYTQAQNQGASWEYAILLANQTNKDIWVSIPHKASDAYITSMANLFKEQLNPNLKVYLEYSNELWNGGFIQHHDCGAMGQDLGYTGQEWERCWKFTAKRSADIFHIFETVFGGETRLVKVIPSQAANSWLSNELVNYFNNPTYNAFGVTADALAIAPYVGGSIGDEIVTEGVVATITIDEILQRLEDELTTAYGYMSTSQTVADAQGLDLICYEGGQHLVGNGANANNTVLTDKLIAANRHADMQDIYCQYFNHWFENSGGLFCHYSSHGAPSKYGSWGVKETMDDMDSPKYLGLQECVFSYNSLSVESMSSENALVLYPNPSNGDLMVSNVEPGSAIRVLNSRGEVVYQTSATESTVKLDIGNLSSGFYIVELNQSTGMVAKKVNLIR